MTRFDLDMDGSMEPSEHGEWVRYEDAQRTWVGLTSDEIAALKTLHGADRERTAIEMAFAVQAKLIEKNT